MDVEVGTQCNVSRSLRHPSWVVWPVDTMPRGRANRQGPARSQVKVPDERLYEG